MNLEKTSMLRYSPRPRSAYIKIVGGHSFGPATSTLLDLEDTWNLAYLSHDYDARIDHPDPNFTTYVRRTCQTRLDGAGLDIGGHPSTLVSSLLALPAPRFVFLIKNHRALPTLPLFVHYGQEWLTLIEERAKLCTSPDNVIDTPLSDASKTVTYELMARLRAKT